MWAVLSATFLNGYEAVKICIGYFTGPLGELKTFLTFGQYLTDGRLYPSLMVSSSNGSDYLVELEVTSEPVVQALNVLVLTWLGKVDLIFTAILLKTVGFGYLFDPTGT